MPNPIIHREASSCTRFRTHSQTICTESLEYMALNRRSLSNPPLRAKGTPGKMRLIKGVREDGGDRGTRPSESTEQSSCELREAERASKDLHRSALDPLCINYSFQLSISCGTPGGMNVSLILVSAFLGFFSFCWVALPSHSVLFFSILDFILLFLVFIS